MNFPATVGKVADIPADFRPAPLGRRADLIQQICEVIPTADFSNPDWGVFDSEGFSIEFGMGSEEVCQSIMFTVRGGGAPVPCVAALLDRLGFRAIDCQTSEFFDVGAARASFASWQQYRDQVIGRSNQKPE